jgi:hypothetical protein
VKEIFTANSGEDWLREVAQIWRDSDNAGIKLAVESGNEHIRLTQEEMDAFNQVLAPVVDRWVSEHSDIEAQALVDAARAAIQKHAG